MASVKTEKYVSLKEKSKRKIKLRTATLP